MNSILEKLASGFRPKKGELEAKLEKLRKERYNARSNKEHNARQMRKAIDEAKMDKYEVYHARRDYWQGRLDKVRQDILLVKEAIKAQEEKERAAEYRKKLESFNKAMVTGLKELLSPLGELVKTQTIMGDISGLAERIYRFYEGNKKMFVRQDLAPYHQLGLLSVRIRCGNILEKVGDMERISSLRGPQFGAQKREHVKLWSRILANQIRDCIKAVEKKGE